MHWAVPCATSIFQSAFGLRSEFSEYLVTCPTQQLALVAGRGRLNYLNIVRVLNYLFHFATHRDVGNEYGF